MRGRNLFTGHGVLVQSRKAHKTIIAQMLATVGCSACHCSLSIPRSAGQPERPVALPVGRQLILFESGCVPATRDFQGVWKAATGMSPQPGWWDVSVVARRWVGPQRDGPGLQVDRQIGQTESIWMRDGRGCARAVLFGFLVQPMVGPLCRMTSLTPWIAMVLPVCLSRRGAVMVVLALAGLAAGCHDPSADSKPPSLVAPETPLSTPVPTTSSKAISSTTGQPQTQSQPQRQGGPEESARSTTDPIPHRVLPEPAGLHNLFAVSSRVYSGSEPQGAEGFDSLVQLGVKTIVSVDGARPQVELARERGIRYVHIPIGYDGVPASAQRALARVMRDNAGAVYMHCHHGKHRGPAAAAIACLTARELDVMAAESLLRDAGTSPDYAGLYRDVRQFELPGPTDELPELVEVATVDSLVSAMAGLGRHFDDLKLCRQAEWQTPGEHPDLVPAGVARLVQEALHETTRTADLSDYPPEFRTLLEESDATADRVAQALAGNDRAEAEKAFRDLEKSCRQCHVRWRDR